VSLESTSAVIGTLGVVTSILFSGAMHSLWITLNGLQIVVHLPLLGIMLPQENQDKIDLFTELANINLIPSLENAYEAAFVLPDEGDVEEEKFQVFAVAGYDSHYFLLNAGSLFIFILLQLLLILLLPVCLPCKRCCSGCETKLGRWKRYLLFGPILRLLLEATLDFSLSIFI